MSEYILNVVDAYRHPIRQAKETWESAKKLKTGIAKADSYKKDDLRASFVTHGIEAKDAYRVISFSLKFLALLPLTKTVYTVGKIAIRKRFTYTSLFLGALAFVGGHDLSKMGHNISRKHIMKASEVAEEDRRRYLGRLVRDATWVEKKTASWTATVIVWISRSGDAFRPTAEADAKMIVKGTLSLKIAKAVENCFKK